MSKFALLICVDDPSIDGGGSSYADALAFSRALKRYWSFNDSEIVVLSSRGRGELYATRANVEKQFETARGVEKRAGDPALYRFPDGRIWRFRTVALDDPAQIGDWGQKTVNRIDVTAGSGSKGECSMIFVLK